MRKLIEGALNRLTSQVVFGIEELKIGDGDEVFKAIGKMHEDFADGLRHPLNPLSGGLLGKYKLLAPVKKAWEKADKIRRFFRDEYKRRASDVTGLKGDNMLDIVVLHNNSAKDQDKLKMDDMIENTASFKGGAVDTSRNVATFTINQLVQSPETFTWYKQNISETFTE